MVLSGNWDELKQPKKEKWFLDYEFKIWAAIVIPSALLLSQSLTGN
jgi:hypothetical protein